MWLDLRGRTCWRGASPGIVDSCGVLSARLRRQLDGARGNTRFDRRVLLVGRVFRLGPGAIRDKVPLTWEDGGC